MAILFLAVQAVSSRAQGQVPDTAAKLPPVRLAALPADGATKQFGFFCRQELKWDKKLPVPVRFRLGSQEACDRLEGKRRD